MNEIVKYHNDLNKIKLPSFTELEQNLLFGILAKLRHLNTSNRVLFDASDLKKFVNKTSNVTNTELHDILTILREKFFKADFTILRKIEVNGEIRLRKSIIHLFNEFDIDYYCHGDNDSDVDDERAGNFIGVGLEVNEKFLYLLENLKTNFTRFELEEFFMLAGKYTKTLYRHLKQFRTTGFAWFWWDDFCYFMDIPSGYRQINIEQRILKPAKKELLKEKTLFDTARVAFNKLNYFKIKGKGKGRGGKVIAICFTFQPEFVDNERNKTAIKENETHKTDEKIELFIGYHIRLKETTRNIYNTLKIISIVPSKAGYKVGLKNMDDGFVNFLEFYSYNHFKNFYNMYKM